MCLCDCAGITNLVVCLPTFAASGTYAFDGWMITDS